MLRTAGLPADWLERYFGAASSLAYRDPEVEDLVDRLAVTVDYNVQDRLHSELTGIFQEQAPALFFFPAVRYVVATRRLEGLASPWRAEPLRYMDELWLEGR